MSDELHEVSKEFPCLHCGGDKWCYHIGNITCCKREAEPASDWQRTSKTDSDGTPYYAPSPIVKAVRSKDRKEFIYVGRDEQPGPDVGRQGVLPF